MMDVTVKVTKKVFTNSNGNDVEYYECNGCVGGQTIRFKIDDRDKSLFDYLYSQSLKTKP